MMSLYLMYEILFILFIFFEEGGDNNITYKIIFTRNVVSRLLKKKKNVQLLLGYGENDYLYNLSQYFFFLANLSQ